MNLFDESNVQSIVKERIQSLWERICLITTEIYKQNVINVPNIFQAFQFLDYSQWMRRRCEVFDSKPLLLTERFTSGHKHITESTFSNFLVHSKKLIHFRQLFPQSFNWRSSTRFWKLKKPLPNYLLQRITININSNKPLSLLTLLCSTSALSAAARELETRAGVFGRGMISTFITHVDSIHRYFNCQIEMYVRNVWRGLPPR